MRSVLLLGTVGAYSKQAQTLCDRRSHTARQFESSVRRSFALPRSTAQLRFG
jgi:hypothetical protein